MAGRPRAVHDGDATLRRLATSDVLTVKPNRGDTRTRNSTRSLHRIERN